MSLLCRLGLHLPRHVLILTPEPHTALHIVYCQRRGCRYGPEMPARIDVVRIEAPEGKSPG